MFLQLDIGLDGDRLGGQYKTDGGNHGRDGWMIPRRGKRTDNASGVLFWFWNSCYTRRALMILIMYDLVKRRKTMLSAAKPAYTFSGLAPSLHACPSSCFEM